MLTRLFGIVIGIGLLIAGLFFGAILLGIFAVMGLVIWIIWRLKRGALQAEYEATHPETMANSTVVEAEYEVIDEKNPSP